MPAKGYRKPDDERRDGSILLRISKVERRVLERGAKKAGRPLAAWVRESALAEASHLVVVDKPETK